MIILKSEREIEIIRRNGKIVAETLKFLGEKIHPGLKTKELDRMAEEFIKKNQAIPAFKGYKGYPANICTSINEEVVHGIPGERVIQKGEIVSVDIGVYKDGYYADGAYTFRIGEVTGMAEQLCQITLECLKKGIEQAREGNRLQDISWAIQSYAEKSGFSVVRDLVGHGIGQKMHEEPQIPNFGNPGEGPILKKGMVFAIEPMINAGGWEVRLKPDGWTIITKDSSLSAHYEHTIAITENHAQILTE
jgi:methionyl aminopeptidase